MLSAEQVANRATGIGGSDAAAALGLNPYRAAIELWREKVGLDPGFTGNEATKWGQLLEPAVRQEYSEQTGRVVRLPVATLRNPALPEFMLCHPDGITDCGRLYEGKCARFADGWGETGSDEIPHHYLLQVQHSLLVTSLPVADVAVLIGGNDFRMYEVPAHRELQELLIEGEREFWRHVETRTEPEIDVSQPGAIEVLKKLYPGTNGQTLIATDAHITARKLIETFSATEKHAKAEIASAKALLLRDMGEAAALRFPDGKVFRRKLVQRAGYVVEASSYIDARFTTAKD